MRDKRSPLASFIAGFLSAKALAPKTKDDYGRYLKKYDDFTGNVSLDKALTLDNAAKWVEELRLRGTFTAHNGCMALKSFSSWIVKQRYLPHPPLAGLEVPKTPTNRREAFTDEQVDLIFRSLNDLPSRARVRAIAYFRLLEATGLRRNEARQIALKDVDLERMFVRVRAQTSKGQKERIVRMTKDAALAIQAYLEVRRPYNGSTIKTDLLFVTETGKPFTEYGFSTWADRIWDHVETKTKIKGSSHWWRHTWATNYNRGMQYTGNNVYDLKREGGWADLTIPLRYTHERPEAELLAMPTPIDAIRRQRAG